MSESDFAAQFAARHGLEKLMAQDPRRFAAQMALQVHNGATMPRLPDKESAPAPTFRVVAA
jgi:hypothetical protein